jgi:hypothetical protein
MRVLDMNVFVVGGSFSLGGSFSIIMALCIADFNGLASV